VGERLDDVNPWHHFLAGSSSFALGLSSFRWHCWRFSEVGEPHFPIRCSACFPQCTSRLYPTVKQALYKIN